MTAFVPPKATLEQLARMLRRLDKVEGILQARYGDAAPRSVRATHKKDAEALRVALAVLQDEREHAIREFDGKKASPTVDPAFVGSAWPFPPHSHKG